MIPLAGWILQESRLPMGEAAVKAFGMPKDRTGLAAIARRVPGTVAPA
ncbi:hypothetical protein [Cryobacterium lactosi]|nr:hypothetical protein [Cryobacterium lactosi]